ncbi:DNA mismatch repair endonuclease MutL [Candidatus Woesearchaeota archaeon]|nr:DNA mismatch repair endonuclease MutL [Candidatus Woesearchaeota archaeon]
MSKIHLLSEEVINKIAAGEVVERPASVVKELVENALDAGAAKIIVELKDSGKELIKITDNGCGMTAEDAEKALLRHATSKIKDADDLSALATLGFRGEALASIAAVSQLQLITKTSEASEGYSLSTEGGKIVHSTICAAQQGTSIEVKNIFFNTPARKKFLKTDAVELHHCVDVVTRCALIHPNVAFTFIHENKILLQTPSTENLQNTLAAVYGTSVAKELIHVQYTNGEITISGFVSSPYQVRNDNSQQTLSVNQRWVRSEDVTGAVYHAYHSLLFVNKHPVFVLHLEIDPDKIDVNVHPNKLTIKFEQKELVQQVVKQAILDAFQKNNLFPTAKDEQDVHQLAFGTFSSPVQNKSSPSSKYSFEESTQKVFETEGNNLEVPATAYLKSSTSVVNLTSPTEEKKLLSKPELYSKLPPLRLLGQIHKTFFVAETEGGFVMIDQHAAHERVVYEQFMAQFMTEKVAVQELLQGDILELSPAQSVLVEKNLPLLQQFGFSLENFGMHSFIVKTIPSVLGRTQSKEVLLDIIATLHETEKNSLGKVQEVQEEIVTRMACRAAVMAGEELTNERMKGILEELSHCKLPYTCPHGRPTMMKTEAEELEKKFRRK